jgi:hypothetical protein
LLHYEHARLSGYDCEIIKMAAIAAGLPVIDSRPAPFGLVARLAVRGPMIAVNRPPDPPPWHGFSFAPLAVVASAYRRAGAEVFNIEDATELSPLFEAQPSGPLVMLLDEWLGLVRTDGFLRGEQ